MKTVLVILNGIRLPFHVIEFAISRAKEDSSEIFALFLKGGHEQSKGYIFPSDLGSTETGGSDSEALMEDETIIYDNMKIVRSMVEAEKIPYREILRTNASLSEIATISEDADLIVLEENFDHVTLLGDEKVSLKKLMEKTSKPVEIVPESRSR